MIRAPICPVCSKAVSAESGAQASTFPFCSERCRQVDLLRWSQGKYAIVEPLDPEHVAQESPEFEDLPDETI
jgi:hypothetical protein